MSKETKKGGTRVGAGRKPLENKKKPITIYVTPDKIEEHGGEESLKKKLGVFASTTELINWGNGGNPNINKEEDKSGINEDELKKKARLPLKFAKPKGKKAKGERLLGTSINYKETTAESYDAPPMDKFIQDEFGQMGKHGFAKEDIAVIEKLKEAGEELKSLLDGNPPVRQKDEDPIDFAARKNEWKKAHNKK